MWQIEQSTIAVLVFLGFILIAPLTVFGVLAFAESRSKQRRAGRRKRRKSNVPTAR